MSTGFVAGAVLALILGAVPPAIAQEKRANEIKEFDEGKATAHGKMSKVRHVTGVVKSVQSDGFVVSGKEQNKERDWAFAITDKTTMTRGKSVTGAGDLKPGDAVTVDYVEQGGKVIAHSVMVKDDGTSRPLTEGAGTTKK